METHPVVQEKFLSDQNTLEDFTNQIKNPASKIKLTTANVLRDKIKEIRQILEMSLAEAIDPLDVFPEEIWTMILENVTATNDLAACKVASSLLNRLVKPTEVELLLGKVMPMMSEFLEENEVLICRLICKHWQAGVDDCLKNHFDIKQMCQSNVDKLTVADPKYLGRTCDTLNNFHTVVYIPNQERPFENPLPTKSVTLRLEHCQTFEKAVLLRECESLVIKVKEHVQYLDIEYVDKQDKFTVSDFFDVCQFSLQKCPNLKRLFIESLKVKESSDVVIEDNFLFHHLPCLTSLSFLVNCENSLKNLDQLVQLYSPQLKHLIVKNWNNELNHTFCWNELIELKIATGCEDKTLESLQKLNAPKLQVLELCLDMAATSLKHLLKTAQNFQHLQVLKLECHCKYPSWPNEEISSIPLDIIMGTSLHTLDVKAAFHKFNFNVLLCFPLLKTLVLRKKSKQEVPENFVASHEFINIVSHIPSDQNTGLLYKSNVWEILTQLQTIQIVEKWKEYNFTHEGYHWFVKDSKEKWNQVMKIIQKNANYIIQENRHKCLTNLKETITKKIAGADINSMKNLDEVFQLLHSYLDKTSILSCRVCCTGWNRAVDTYLDRKPHPHFIYKFGLPLDQNKDYGHENLRERFKSHFRNPFVGKAVEIQIHQNFNLILEARTADTDHLFKDIGKNIAHLKLANKEGTTLRVVDFYYILQRISKYCKNLESLDVRNLKLSWGKDYYREEKLIAPKLTWLGIRDDRDKSWPLNWTIRYITNCFPKLQNLEICFGNNSTGIQIPDIGHLDPYLICYVENLRLVLTDKYQVSFDFLIHFPLLRKLTILHGKWIAHWHQLDPEREPENLPSHSKPKLVKKSREDREDGFIPLAKHLWEEEGYSNESSVSVYESNVWTVLPRLRLLEVGKGTSEFGKNIIKFYSRKAYEHGNRNN